MTVETKTPAAQRVYDRALIAGARRFGAWGPGLLTKAEGLWKTQHGVYVIGERVEGDDKVSYRVIEHGEAADALRAHGQPWRATQIEKAEAPESLEADTDAAPADADVAATDAR